jgi:hypothetical protein
MNAKITLEVRENFIDTRFGKKPHTYSQWGVYQVIKKNGVVVGNAAVCLIPDFHIDPEGTAHGIVKALNKSGIMPIIDETL